MATIAEQIRERLAELEPQVSEYTGLRKALSAIEDDNVERGFRLENGNVQLVISALKENPDGMSAPEVSRYLAERGYNGSIAATGCRIARMKREGIVTRRRRLSDGRIVYVLKERPDATQE